MNNVKSGLIGLITFILILLELIIGFGTLAIINLPRGLVPFKSFKIFLSKVSNFIGDLTVYGLKIIMLLMHGNNIEIIDDGEEFDQNDWYMAMSNHQSWADIFVLLVSANYKIPLLKFFMKKRVVVDSICFFSQSNFKYALCKQALKRRNAKKPRSQN